MNAIYAIAIVATLLFVASAVVPEDLNANPLDVEIGTESEYPASDSIEILEMNVKNAVNLYGNPATVFGQDGTELATVYPDDDASVTVAVTEINLYGLSNPDHKVVLKGGDGETLTQEMIIRESNEISINIYTEIFIINNLRYDLLDIDIGVDQISETGNTKYRIVSSEPTTIATGETASLPINLEINTLNSALIMLIGDSTTFDINIGLEISGKYLYGIAGVSVYATAKFSTSTTNPIVIDIEENKVTVTSDDKLDMIPVESLSASIGDIDVVITNDDLNGFSVVIDSGTAMTILEVLEAQYANEDYTIEIDTGDPDPEIIELTKEQYAQLIDIVEQVMAGVL